jgi:hypothetical protein
VYLLATFHVVAKIQSRLAGQAQSSLVKASPAILGKKYLFRSGAGGSLSLFKRFSEKKDCLFFGKGGRQGPVCP